MLRSKREAAAKRSVAERIVKTLEEEKTEENDCVLDAIEETEDYDLKTLPAARYPVVNLGSTRLYTRHHALNHGSPLDSSRFVRRAVVHLSSHIVPFQRASRIQNALSQPGARVAITVSQWKGCGNSH